MLQVTSSGGGGGEYRSTILSVMPYILSISKRILEFFSPFLFTGSSNNPTDIGPIMESLIMTSKETNIIVYNNMDCIFAGRKTPFCYFVNNCWQQN